MGYLILIKVFIIASVVEITFELASYPLWMMIIFMISPARSTLDSSSMEEEIVPIPPITGFIDQRLPGCQQSPSKGYPLFFAVR